MSETGEKARADIRRWLESCVLGLNLCPFAHKPFREGRVRIASSPLESLHEFWANFKAELSALDGDERISNTLFVIEDQTLDFYAYLGLLHQAEKLLRKSDLEGVFQIASFHPQYLFDGEDPQSRGHFTNRSPWPMFHLLREDEVSQAIESYRNTESIPEANKKTLDRLSEDQFIKLFDSKIIQR